MIGKFEELVLLSAIKVGPQGVPSEIFAVYEDAMKRVKVNSFGSFYTTLERLSKKGLLEMEKIPDPSGRIRKHYTISSSGRNAVNNSIQVTHALGGLSLAGG